MANPSRDWITLAILLRARGIKGEIAADPLGSTPERYESVRQAWIVGDKESDARPVEIENVWQHQDELVFKFRGIDSRNDAEALERSELRIPFSERAPAEEGEFYVSDLVGCEVVTKEGVRVGKVAAWQDYGAGGLLQVVEADREFLIPFAKSICVEINPGAGRIVIDPPEGLLEM